MKSLMTLAWVVALLAASTVQAEEVWRAAAPRNANSAALAQLPLAEDSGIVPTDDAGQAPLVRSTAPAEAQRSTSATFTTVSAAKVVIDNRSSFEDQVPSSGEFACGSVPNWPTSWMPLRPAWAWRWITASSPCCPSRSTGS